MSPLLPRPRNTAGPFPQSGSAQPEQNKRDTVVLFERLRDPRCRPADRIRLREQIVDLYLPLAERLARNYRNRGELVEDLVQVAAVALVKAVDRYDPARGVAFASFAVPTITGELKRHFRDCVWTVHVPRPLQERCLRVSHARTGLIQRLRREPSTGEIAAEMGLTVPEVDATGASASAYRADSLNHPIGVDGADERQDTLGRLDTAMENVCNRVTVAALMDTLDPRTRNVVDRYFFAGRTQTEIADELGTSQMTVSRVLTRALTQLRDRLSATPAPNRVGPRPR